MAHHANIGGSINTRIIIAIFTLVLSGCSSVRQFTVAERDNIKESQKIYKVELIDGTEIRFDSDPLGYALLRPNSIDRIKADGSIESIDLTTVKTIFTERPNAFLTVMAIVVSVLGLCAIALGSAAVAF